MRLLITWLWFNVAEILDFRRVCACYLYTLFMSFYLMFGIVRITLGLRHKFASQMVSTECCLSIKTKQIRNMIVHRIYVHVNLKNPLVWKSLNCRKKEERRVPHTHIYISSGLHIKTFFRICWVCQAMCGCLWWMLSASTSALKIDHAEHMLE